MVQDDLRRELKQLQRRVERIEQMLEQLTPAAPALPPTPPTLPPTPVPPPPVPELPQRPPRPLFEPSAFRRPRLDVQAAASKTAASARPGAPRTGSSSSALELLIGGKLAAWVGAIVIVIGVALLVHLGIQSGWWGGLPASLRCLLVAVFGGLLLVGGELALRLISRAASVGLFGAALGVLYLDAFAAFKFFEIVSSDRAFVLLALVAAFGFACTLRTRFLTIGVLSLVGGYLAPILIGGGGAHDLELASFLTALFGVALGLSAVDAEHYRSLRYVGLGGQVVIGFAWLVNSGSSVWFMAIVFLSIWWSMLLAESFYAARRDQSILGNPIAVLLASSAYVSAGCWLLDEISPAEAGERWLAAFTVAVAALCVAAALRFGSGFQALRGGSRAALDKLTQTLWAQSGVLLVTAAAMQFEGFGQTVSWLAIAVAAIETGRRLPSRGVDIFGLIVGALALISVADAGLSIASGNTLAGLSNLIWDGTYLHFTRWSVLTLLAIAAALAVAHRLRERGLLPWTTMPVMVTAVAAQGWPVFGAGSASGLLVTAIWIGGAFALLIAHRLGQRQRYVEIALAMLAEASARWLMIDALGVPLRRPWDPDPLTPFLNGQMALALALSAGFVWALRLLPQAPSGSARAPASLVRSWAPVVSALILLVGLSFEVDRAVEQLGTAALDRLAFHPAMLRALWWTGLWSAGAVVMILIGDRGRARMLVASGWVALYASGASWLIFETLVWRTVHGVTDTTLVFNLQFAVGLLIALLLAVLLRLTRGRSLEVLRSEGWPTHYRPVILVGLPLLGLWLGSIEIDRSLANTPTAAQAGLSVYWAIYGAALVVLGFVKRSAPARRAGLALLAVTVAKVLLVDLSNVHRTWRVASFLVSGILLVATSVLYTKLSPRLLNEEQERRPGDPPMASG